MSNNRYPLCGASYGARKERITSRRTLIMAALMLSSFGGACAAIEQQTSGASISLDLPVHFLASDGGHAVAAPGSYRLEITEQSLLRLVPSEGKEAHSYSW